MHIPQPDLGVGRREAGRTLGRVATEDRGAEAQARNAAPIDTAEPGQAACLGELHLLMDGGQRRLAAILGLAIPFAEVEAGADAGGPGDAAVVLAEQLHAALAPGRRNDGRLDEVSLHAVVGRGLVVGVEQADRHQEETGAQAIGVVEAVLDVELLDLDLALVGRGCDGMLDLQLRDQLAAFVEAMLQADDEAPDVRLGLAAVLGPVVVDFAVAADDRGGLGACGGRCGNRWQRRRRGGCRLGGGLGGGLGLLELLQLGLDALQFARQQVDALQQLFLCAGVLGLGLAQRAGCVDRQRRDQGEAGQRDGAGGAVHGGFR
mmetsp:Transcript_15771/g.43666  ORF Transcript_15771/g.43666 Transcript_15771/m.43666 type:complete len:319 (+) Transcript_15771:950-1906(+)